MDTENFYTSPYGGTFCTAAERDAWEAWIKARLANARIANTLSDAEVRQRFKQWQIS